VGEARIRVKSESGVALRAGGARFGRVGRAISPDRARRRGNAERFGYQHVAELRTESQEVISLYELQGAVSLLYGAEGYSVCADVEGMVRALRDPENWQAAPKHVVGEMKKGEYLEEGFPGTITSWERPTPGEVRVRLDMDGPGLLIFNETFDRGWRAYVNDEPVAIWRMNGVVQGIGIPSGAREVRLVYRNPGLKTGAMLSLVGWGGLLAAGVLFRRRRPES